MTVGSLFSGIGGLDLGLEWAGMETIWFCEIEDYPRAVLKKHWPSTPIYRDVREINADNAVRPDVIAGGFPCQPFSIAGKRQGTEDDRNLWPEMLRVIRALRPRYVIGENVPGILNWNDGQVFEQVLSDLEASGYETLPPVVLPAAGYGATHKRERVFICAHAEGFGRARRRNDGAGTPDEFEGLAREHRRRWAEEPRPLGVDDGATNRVDRIKALGNAVVPQVAYVVGRAVMEHARATS